MKKILSISLLVLCIAMKAYAITVDVDGIRYEIISTTDLTARVLGYADVEFANVAIPEYIEYYGKQFKVIEIGDQAFSTNTDGPSCISSIALPLSLQKIGKQAFYWNCLKVVDIPVAVTDIGERAFWRSENLQKFTFGRGVSNISYLCLSFSSIDYLFLPNNIKTIDGVGIVSNNIKEFVIEDSNVKLVGTAPEFKTKIYWESEGTSTVISEAASMFACCYIENLYLGRNISSGNTSISFLPRVENLTVGPYVTDLKGLFNLDYMQRIKLMTNTPPLFDRGSATEECYMRVKVYVPKGSLSAYKNHTEWGKYWNIEEYDDACEAPEISYEDGVLKVTPITSGSICYYTITDEDIVTDNEMTGGIKLSGTYNIEAYAVLNGSKSERSYATLCWLDNTFTSTDITQPMGEPKRPILIKPNNRQIVVEGLEDGETVDLYSIDGKHLGRATANGNQTTINSAYHSGQPLILRAGENSVKFIMR